MKKVIACVVVGMMVVALASCGNKPAENTTNAAQSQESRTSAQEDQGNEVQDVFYPHSSYDSAYATIEVNESIEMDDNTAWLGFCPAGKDYVTELEADEADIIWWAAEAYEKGERAVFACDFGSVEDGKYALVVCTSDDETVGYVVIQMDIEKKGDKLTFDYDSAELKDRPAK